MCLLKTHSILSHWKIEHVCLNVSTPACDATYTGEGSRSGGQRLSENEKRVSKKDTNRHAYTHYISTKGQRFNSRNAKFYLLKNGMNHEDS